MPVPSGQLLTWRRLLLERLLQEASLCIVGLSSISRRCEPPSLFSRWAFRIVCIFSSRSPRRRDRGGGRDGFLLENPRSGGGPPGGWGWGCEGPGGCLREIWGGGGGAISFCFFRGRNSHQVLHKIYHRVLSGGGTEGGAILLHL